MHDMKVDLFIKAYSSFLRFYSYIFQIREPVYFRYTEVTRRKLVVVLTNYFRKTGIIQIMDINTY